MENISLPETGGLFSTDGLIVLGVAVFFVILYILFCMLRKNKTDDLKEFRDDDFISDKQEKQ